MEESTVSLRQLATTSKRFARRLLTIGENRLELLAVEVQEERERLLHAFLLALGDGGLRSACQSDAHGSHCGFAVGLVARRGAPDLQRFLRRRRNFLYRRLSGLLRNWQTLPASLEQLRKDRACLGKILA